MKCNPLSVRLAAREAAQQLVSTQRCKPQAPLCSLSSTCLLSGIPSQGMQPLMMQLNRPRD